MWSKILALFQVLIIMYLVIGVPQFYQLRLDRYSAELNGNLFGVYCAVSRDTARTQLYLLHLIVPLNSIQRSDHRLLHAAAATVADA